MGPTARRNNASPPLSSSSPSLRNFYQVSEFGKKTGKKDILFLHILPSDHLTHLPIPQRSTIFFSKGKTKKKHKTITIPYHIPRFKEQREERKKTCDINGQNYFPSISCLTEFLESA